MIRKNEPHFLYLTANQVRKLEIVVQSIEEPVTRRDVIGGLIDGAYALALKNLYKDKLISRTDYEKCIAGIPDYILKELSSIDSKSVEIDRN
jgi:hypothetical protein